VTNPKSTRTRWKIALGVVALFAVVGWLVASRPSERQRAIQEIERVGGSIFYDDTGPLWLRRWGIGVDRVRVVEVHLEEREITDNGLKHLSHLTHLTWLSLSGTHVDGNGLKHLVGLTNLEYLYLGDTEVTEVGVKMLQESLPNCHIDWK
jgi:hypothetical protein